MTPGELGTLILCITCTAQAMAILSLREISASLTGPHILYPQMYNPSLISIYNYQNSRGIKGINQENAGIGFC